MTAAKKERQAETVKAITDNAAETSPSKATPVTTAAKKAFPSPTRKRAKSSPGKQEIILRLLKRSKGARMQDLQKATGWQAHSIRAGLSGLRKKGIRIELTRTASGKIFYKAVEG
ncbi:DUF3489 domain-containing protein [uncultured Sneathiella sp.]|uniref:DUF3489 domain-containing protein n=1 Tax=uncultured Sneathiella sp. TaxID=879315 RepID=UPI0030EF4CE8|tara:strand:+ start:1148 stop:1492 length:345 start_codon:yes stop_codon:yes gene_type:complete